MRGGDRSDRKLYPVGLGPRSWIDAILESSSILGINQALQLENTDDPIDSLIPGMLVNIEDCIDHASEE